MINNANPFLGAYKMPKKKQMTGMGFGGGQSEPFLSSEEVIGRPDAQNTAQRSKSVASGMKDAYDAVQKAKDLIPKTPQEEMSAFEKQKQDTFKKYGSIGRNPFSGEKAMAFDAANGKGELTPKLQEIVNANFAEFQAVSEILDRKNNPSKYAKIAGMDMGMGGRNLMAMGESKTIGQLGQSSSTANVASQYEVAYDKSGNPYRQERKSATMLPANVSQYETIGTRLNSMAARQGQPIAATTPRIDAMAARNSTSRQNALTPGTDFSGRKINTDPSAYLQQRLKNKQYGDGVYSQEYMDIYNSF